MPISINWDNDNQTILRLTFWNEWTIEEFVATGIKQKALMQLVNHTVDTLVDIRTDAFVPMGNTLKAFRYVMDNLPRNAGIIVYVTDDPVQRHLFGTHISFYYSLRRRWKRRIFIVPTLREAYDFINQQSASL
jgi:hypothetical protein